MHPLHLRKGGQWDFNHLSVRSRFVQESAASSIMEFTGGHRHRPGLAAVFGEAVAQDKPCLWKASSRPPLLNG